MHSCIRTNAQLLLDKRRVSRLCNFLSNSFLWSGASNLEVIQLFGEETIFALSLY